MTCEVETCGKPVRRQGLCIGHAWCFALGPVRETRAAFLARQAKQARDEAVRAALARTLQHTEGT
jgi:hypothetical protein